MTRDSQTLLFNSEWSNFTIYSEWSSFAKDDRNLACLIVNGLQCIQFYHFFFCFPSDVNECFLFSEICEGGGHCVNNEGSFTCRCPEGLELDSSGRRCIGK